MPRIRLINCYFGKLPAWWDAFLLSCEHNSSVEFLLLSDCVHVQELPDNVKIIDYSLAELNSDASDALHTAVRKGFYSQVDLKPAYGIIFQNQLADVEFWGHYDLDVIWGNIRSFVTDDILMSYNIISSRKGASCGHFTLFRNDDETNRLILKDPDFKDVLSSRNAFAYDERGLSTFLRRFNYQKIYWNQQLVVGKRELAERPHGWRWQHGRLYDVDHRERMYIHFMKWKPYMSSPDFRFMERPEGFAVTRRKIYAHQLSIRDRLLNAWPADVPLHKAASWLQTRLSTIRRNLRKGIKSIRRTLVR